MLPDHDKSANWIPNISLWTKYEVYNSVWVATPHNPFQSPTGQKSKCVDQAAPANNRISNSLIEPGRGFQIHSCHLTLEGTQPRRQAPGREGGQKNIYLSKWNRTITIPMDAIDIGPTITRINGISGVLFFFMLKPWNWITRIAAIFPTNAEEFPPVNLVSVKVPPRVALSDLNYYAQAQCLHLV